MNRRCMPPFCKKMGKGAYKDARVWEIAMISQKQVSQFISLCALKAKLKQKHSTVTWYSIFYDKACQNIFFSYNSCRTAPKHRPGMSRSQTNLYFVSNVLLNEKINYVDKN